MAKVKKTYSKGIPDEAPVKKTSKVTKKTKPAGLTATELSKSSSMFLRECCNVMRHEYGQPNIAAAGEAGRIVIGIPLPGLAMEYLIQNTVFPLGRMTQVVGTEGTCKSALTFEMARWFRNYSGITYLLENESKYSNDYATSIIGRPANEDDEALLYIPCNSLEDWQTKIQQITRLVKERMTKVGRRYPVLMILDSIMGKLSMESQASIEKAGFADRSFPVEALKINSFLKKYPQDIEEWPISFVAVNHLKPAKAEHGMHMERNKSGGRSISFQETFEIEMKRDQQANIHLVDDENFEMGGLKLVLACKKNSLGETERKIKTEIRWTYREDPETGEFHQVTKWDWPMATTKLLLDIMSQKGHRAERLKEVVDIGGTGNKLTSKALGVTSADPLNPHDLGVQIEADHEIMSNLRKLFGIKPRKAFDLNVDYLAQLASVKESVGQFVKSETAAKLREASEELDAGADADYGDEDESDE